MVGILNETSLKSGFSRHGTPLSLSRITAMPTSTQPTTPKYRRWRFTLFTLLLLFTSFGRSGGVVHKPGRVSNVRLCNGCSVWKGKHTTTTN